MALLFIFRWDVLVSFFGGGNTKASKPGVPPSGGVRELFGATLLTTEGEKPTDEVLAGKTQIFVYFSAHW